MDYSTDKGSPYYRAPMAEQAAPILAEVKRRRANKARRDRDQLRRDCGLVKVRGALGGTYWE